MKKRLLTLLTGIVMVFGVIALAACTPTQTETETKYKVIYVAGAQNATGTAPAEAEYVQGFVFTLSANPFTNQGYTFAGWNDGTATYEAGASYTMPANAVTFTAQWTENQVTPPAPTEIKISFDMNGHGTAIAAKVATDGKITAPAAPTDEDYDFGGWFANKECTGTAIDFATATFEESTTVYAKWTAKPVLTPEPTPTEIKISFDLNGHGTAIEDKVATDGKITAPAAPTDEDYDFGGWFATKECTGTAIDFATATFEESTTVYAKWTAKQEIPPEPTPVVYTVTFTRGGEDLGIAPQKVKEGEKVTKPQDPTDEKKTFIYWADENGEFDFDTPITSDLTLEPVFQIVISYDIGEGATGTAPANDSKTTYPRGLELPAKTASMAKEGYKFVGWSDGTKTYKAGETYMPDHSIKLVAVWEEATNQLTVTFNPNNAEKPQTWTVKVDSGEKVAKPATDPTIEGGKLFRYWEDENGAEYDFDTLVTANITLTAKFGYRITFSLGEGVEGTAPETIWTGYGTKLPSAIPVREGYKFNGWTDGTDTYNAGQQIYGKTLDLTAVWEDNTAIPPVATYTVTFRKANTFDKDVLDTISGTIPTMEDKAEGAKFTLPANPFTRQYFVFAGWSDGTNIYQPGDEYTMPAKNVSFRAEWTALFVQQYTDDYEGYIFLPDTREGSYADGVFDFHNGDDEDGYPIYDRVAISYTIEGNKVTITAPFTAEGTLKNDGVNITINYNASSYVFGTPDPVAPTVTFDANGGTGTDPVCTPEYNSNSGNYKIVLPDNTYTAPENKTFKCWSIGGDERKAGQSFFANSGETITITAVWEDVITGEPEVPAGVIFEGNCTIPVKNFFGGHTVSKIIVNFENYEATYYLSGGSEANITLTDNGYPGNKPTIYGDDAYYLDAKIDNISCILLVKKDMTKLYICDENDNLLENGEFTARAEDSEWVTIATGEGSEFYNMCASTTNLYFEESFVCNNTTFLGIQFFKNSLGIGLKPIYDKNGTETVVSSTVSYSSAEGSLLVFSNNNYEIKMGKKSDGKYYIISFKYITKANGEDLDTTERALSGETAPTV